MTYNLRFTVAADKEWKKLGETIRQQFARKLSERLEAPNVPSAALRKMPGCYKIKLKSAGYRLVYRVEETTVTVLVVAIGRREAGEAYLAAARRLAELD